MKLFYSAFFKIILFSIIFILPMMNAQGQDVIIKKNGEEIKGKVIEILDLEIKYKTWDNLEGPLYNIKKSDVLIIIFENGKKEVINPQNSPNDFKVSQVKNINPAINKTNIARAQIGSIIDYAMILPLLGLGTAGLINDGNDNQALLGLIAGGLAGLGIPLSAIVSGNPMKKAGVKGSPACRIPGWILWSFTIGSSIIAQYDYPDFARAIAPLAIVSTTLIGLDNSSKAIQGRGQMRLVTLQPSLKYVPTGDGNKYLTIGFRLNF